MNPPALEVRDLVVQFGIPGPQWRRRQGNLEPVSGVSLAIPAGRTLGLVGESGCGKSSLARAIAGLLQARTGSVWVDGRLLHDSRKRISRRRRSLVQLVFQDPYASLNPRLTVQSCLDEALGQAARHARGDLAERRSRLLQEVGLDGELLTHYPDALSGGQRQRVAIARALAVQPRVIIADEPTSALDVTVQARILNLLRQIQAARGLALLLISHDLHVVRQMAHEVAVMYLGQLVEVFPAGNPDAPRHPYGRALDAAAPSLGRQPAREPATGSPGEVASLRRLPTGCRYHRRCELCEAACRTEEPPLVEVGPGHLIRCPVTLRRAR